MDAAPEPRPGPTGIPASEEALVEGTFIQVHIDGILDGELSGYIVED